MSKNIESLITKVVKKIIKKELENLQPDESSIISTQLNQSLDTFFEKVSAWENDCTTQEIVEKIYADNYTALSAAKDAEVDLKLRELKFKQELRKDWILFIVKDVIVFPATILFIFAVTGYYLFRIINRY